ncbi:tRNA pseudouridine(38-40) synthase TruA [Cohnella endophytica]|uniref:tRNA pseudouridine synthase A n=1 Tax=Cohnella endophytica TaxID=2419778 RepID=A0A494X663_9BACL|nr:tRNA pseudouridine(38-40) synthase TruA [Cohnella endophytica]RKP45131.1 tRNA pseudouridine(38-40) synthase TruA [Cohnella endophytica]
MRNIALIVSYDGTDYYGFQSQPGGNTIQDALEQAVYLLTGEHSSVFGSGRTDGGVHARCQVVNFLTESTIPIERWALALNTRLPDDIVVQSVYLVPDSFHARHDALSKTYRYSINCNRIPDLFRRRYEFHHPTPLDFAAMEEGLTHLIGEHDFTSFTSPLSTKRSHVRTILKAKIHVEKESESRLTYPDYGYGRSWDERYHPGRQRGTVHMYVTGTGFLYNMVRIIAGTLIQVGEGKRKPSDMASILAACNRKKAGPTAVPHGLSLWEVEYEAITAIRQGSGES